MIERSLRGSYNYSKNAEYRNAENLLIIKIKPLANIYTQNFQKRLSVSMTLSNYEAMKEDKFSNTENTKRHSRKNKANYFKDKG